MSQVQQFYTGQNIFITGGTGFLGKALTEKLLRSCPDIGTIYLLIRAKKGKSTKERIDALLGDSVFEVLRDAYQDFSKKIVGIAGDISEEGLGLSATDHARLVDEVSVIFHLAATIRFNEKLDRAVAINVNSVKSIVDIAKACKNLKVGIYVSTAFSHCPRKLINEELYPPPLSYEEVNELIKGVWKSEWSDDDMQNFTQGVLGEWPNTYSFTKAIAEGVIAEYAKDMPFAVFRPSIVMNAHREPIPGWLAGPIGVPGLICACGLGIVHAFLIDKKMKFDIVPVDYVCNALIASGWNTAVTEKRHQKEIPAYNYVSGNGNPTTCQQLYDRVAIFGRIYPSNMAIYWPTSTWTSSRVVFSVLDFFFHLIPALIIDSIASLFGKQLGLYKIARKVGEASRALAYFGTQQWDFEDQRVQNLWKGMGLTDKQIFPFNIRDVNWDEHCMNMIRGLRRYLTNDPEETVVQARRRHVYLYIIHTILRLAFGISVLWIFWKMFYGNGTGVTIGTETLVK